MIERMDRSFDAVLCDLDGVLRRWDDLDLDAAHGLPTGTFATAAFGDSVQAAVTGACTDQQWRAAVEAALAEVSGAATARAVVADWSASIGRVDDAVADLLRQTAVPVVLVTNATTRLDADLAALGIGGLVEAVVNSSRVGVAKPDERIYRVAAERAGVPVERCLFVDDSAANVDAARALGMIGVHYRVLDDLRSALAR
jgi:putative hydrolase of the HAD superfamily